MASCFLLLIERGIDHRGIQHLTGAVHHRHLAAVAVAGVEAHGDLALDGRLHQQRPEVQRKLPDCPLAGGIRQISRGLRAPATGKSAGHRHPPPQNE